MDINVGTVLNRRYIKYTYVMLQSLLENQNTQNKVRIFLMHRDLAEADQRIFRQLAEKFGQDISFLKIDTGRFPELLPTTENWPVEIYFRLLLSELLPEDVERFLYLDVDTIVNKPLDDLFCIDFEGNCLCACPDAFQPPFADLRQQLFEKQIKSNFTYFNSGVVLFNMGMLREKYHFEDYIKLAEDLNYQVYAPDQDLLNYMHWGEVKFLPAGKYDLYAKNAYRCGVHYDEVKAGVSIVHFTGEKPWQGKFAHYDIEKIWCDYALKTPFATELMREYIEGTQDPYIYDSLIRLSEANKQLVSDLKQSVDLCQKLLQKQ